MTLVPHYRERRDYGELAVTRDDDRWNLFFCQARVNLPAQPSRWFLCTRS